MVTNMLKDKGSPNGVRSSRPRVGELKAESGPPAPGYSRVSERLRRSSSGSIQCSLFCGGQSCKYETPLHWGVDDKALRGLYSHWITERILAMARPSTFLFKVFDLIGQFKSLEVRSVINLQCPWEHARCGLGLEVSGFTYTPQHLMKEGVFYYNFCWSDYDVPSLEALLDAVKVIDYALSMGKVAVHCHAGLGRTGVLIACHLVYSLRCTGNKAIAEVRRKRPGSIQTRPQIQIVQQFSLHLSTLWTFFPLVQIHNHQSAKVICKDLHTKLDSEGNGKGIRIEQGSEVSDDETPHLRTVQTSEGIPTISSANPHGTTNSGIQFTVEKPIPYAREQMVIDSLLQSDECVSVPTSGTLSSVVVKGGKSDLSFGDLLYNQSQVLHGEMQIDLKYTPKVIHDICVRLTELSRDRSCDLPFDVILHPSTVNNGTCKINPSSLNALCCHDNCMDGITYTSVQAIQVEMNSSLEWTLLRRETNPNVLLILISLFFTSLKVPFLSSDDVSQLKPTSPISSLPDSKSSTIKKLLLSLNVFVNRQLRCGNPHCRVSILTALCTWLASIFLHSHCEGNVCGVELTDPKTNILATFMSEYLNHQS